MKLIRGILENLMLCNVNMSNKQSGQVSFHVMC